MVPDVWGLQRCLKLGWLVNIRSRVLSFLVGKSTCCSKLLSATIFKNALFTLLGYCVSPMFWSLRSISGRLKSPPPRTMIRVLVFGQ